ncbi:MAG: type 1 glutamine amidotransferase [Desulfuromonadaceae bacterium]|nr:type 1 glutamine amidotransferase [Desulfuromonadaceae bacterium]MDD2856133.1 type 1 glutamine amidotransferase [Desulfuromonadaceae bacterium]
MLHVIQNDPEVPPGNILDSLKVPYLIHHPYRVGALPDVSDISALIVLGGAMGANDDQRHPFLADLKNLIRSVVESSTPYLGICLGGQLLAAALGGDVVSNRWDELGTLEVSLTQEGVGDRLFSGIPDRFSTFQWHHDSFDIPTGGVLLASSAACSNQAFRVGERAWGLQFHPEVTEPIVRAWCAWDRTMQERTEEIVSAFSVEKVNYRKISRQLIENFLKVAGLLNQG